MATLGRIAGVTIDPWSCWGQYVGEDSDAGACQVCVELCPAVFEKPAPDECARVRPNARLKQHSDLIVQAVSRCPVNGIRVAWTRRVRRPGRQEVVGTW